MKRFKKIIICMLSLAMLCGSQLLPVNASTVAENEVLSTTDVQVVRSEKDGVAVFFYFGYSDGSDAWLNRVSCLTTGCRLTSSSSHFSGDTCYATAVVTISSGAQITLNAWCDIYGQTGSY